MRLSGVIGAAAAVYFSAAVNAACSVPVVPGQYIGDVIPNSLGTVPGSEITFFKIKDPSGQYVCTSSSIRSNLTLINYMSLNSTGGRLVQSKVQRAVIVIHGLNRDPGTYEANMLSALAQVTGDSTINKDTVAVMAPYFPSGADKGVGYPWNATGQYTWQRAYTSALVWYASDWSAGAINQYPSRTPTVSSYDALDQVIQWFGNSANFPNLKQIVIAGHSLGGQMVQRYVAVGKTPAQLGVSVPISYWIGDPNSLVWLNETRPLTTSTCPDYDVYREGFTNYTFYGADETEPMTYNLDLVNSGRANIAANFQSKAVNWARATLDYGDQSNGCAPYTTGKDRNERFFSFIKQFPPSCPNPAGSDCDTVDLVNTGHDAGTLFASPAGRARLFMDNWSGNGARAYDFGYPRETSYDDPYPDPSQQNQPLLNTDTTTYAGGMKYAGCWSDVDNVQTIRTLNKLVYSGSSNSRDYCTNTCVQAGYTIAGLNGNNCYCASNVSSEAAEVVSTSCQINCPGNSAQICGGNNRLSLFSTGDINHLPAPKNPGTVGNFTEAGCYTEASSGRALNGKGTTSTTQMSIEYCANYCTGSKYFGIEYGQECYCGNSLGTGANLTDYGQCSFQCPANELEFCGAGNRLTLYVDNNWTGTAPPTSTNAGGSTPTGSGISCPGANNTLYTSGGKNFQVECGIDHAGGDLTSVTAQSLSACLDACAANQQCVDVSLSGTACYLKSVLGAAVSNAGLSGGKLVTSSGTSSINTNVNQVTPSSSTSSQVNSAGTSTGVASSASTTSSAVTTSSSQASSTTSSSAASTTTSLSCPASNNTIYVTNGKSFQVECGVDHSGGDMASKELASFNDCVAYCASLSGCVDVSYLGAGCYAKSSLGAVVSAPGVLGAKLVSSSASSGASTSSASASSSATTSTTSSSVQSQASPSTSSSGSMTSTTISLLTTTSKISSLTTSTTISTTSTSSFSSTSSSASVATSSSSSSSTTSSVVSSSTTTPSTSSSTPSTSTTSSRSSTSSTSTSSATASSTPSTTSSTFTTSTRTSTSSSASATITLSCPASNNTIYTAPQVQIECDIDHSGGDMSSKNVASFAACVNLCDSTPGCVDVSMQGAGCYLKKTLGKAVAKKGILGAKLVTSSSSSAAGATATASA